MSDTGAALQAAYRTLTDAKDGARGDTRHAIAATLTVLDLAITLDRKGA